MKKIFTVKELILIFLIACFVSIPLILPLLRSGYFPSHDGEWAVVRAAEMFRELRDNQFPARYSGTLNFGYGYPLFNFAYPFPYYLATVLHFFRFSFIESIKTLFIVSVPLSGFFMYLLSKLLWKNWLAGFLSMILYLYLPYRLVDLYVRGSLGESLAFVLYPLIIFFAVLVTRNVRNLRAAALLALSLGALIGTHNIMAVYMLIILGIFLLSLLFVHKTRQAGIDIAAVVFGFLLSCFFWVPALLEKKNIALSIIPIADRNLYFVKIAQLIIPSWGYGTPTDSNPFTYNIGLAQIAAIILSFCAVYLARKKIKEYYIFIFFTLLTLIFILMMFPFANFFWHLPILSEINYPWTLLLPIGFLTSIISGSMLLLPKTKIIAGILIITAVILTFPNARVSSYINYPDSYYMTNEATTTSSNELMPLWVKTQPTQRFEQKIEGKNIVVSNLIYNSKSINFNLDSKLPQKIQINAIYYPGWTARLNGLSTQIKYNNNHGVMQITVPDGKSNVRLVFKETNTRLIADMISTLSLILLLIVFIFGSKISRLIFVSSIEENKMRVK